MKTIALAGLLALGLCACNSAGSGGAPATGAGAGLDTLINVNLEDIRAEIAKNLDISLERVPISIQLPINLAVNVCNVNVNLLSAQVQAGQTSCNATATSAELNQQVSNQIL